MLTVDQVRDWLAALFPDDLVFAGFIDGNEPMCMGVYQRDAGRWNQAISQDSTYQAFPVKVLLQWGKDVRGCTAKADAVFKKIRANRKGVIGTSKIFDIQMGNPVVILGRNDNGIWEAIVTFTILYEMEEE